jgi:hypothetical protein
MAYMPVLGLKYAEYFQITRYLYFSFPSKRTFSLAERREQFKARVNAAELWPQNYQYLALCVCINRGYMHQGVLNNL